MGRICAREKHITFSFTTLPMMDTYHAAEPPLYRKPIDLMTNFIDFQCVYLVSIVDIFYVNLGCFARRVCTKSDPIGYGVFIMVSVGV